MSPGIVTVSSKHSVDETVSRLKQLLEARYIQLFCTVDHSGEALKAGLRMPNTKLLIFGNPEAGTPLMLAAPTIALDLPLRLLVWEDQGSHAHITYNSPDVLAERHSLPPELQRVLAAVGGIAAEIAGPQENIKDAGTAL